MFVFRIVEKQKKESAKLAIEHSKVMRIYKENEKKLLANHKDVKYIGDLITMELKVYIFLMKFLFEIFIKIFFILNRKTQRQQVFRNLLY